jgi:hypothetical protein
LFGKGMADPRALLAHHAHVTVKSDPGESTTKLHVIPNTP